MPGDSTLHYTNKISVVRRICLIFFCLFLSSAVSPQVFKRESYDIKAQPVSDALLALALDRNLNLVYVAKMTKSIQANSVQGEYSLSEALEILLADTGLRASISNDRMIKIQLLPKKPAIRYTPPSPTIQTQTAAEPEQELIYDGIEEIEVVAKIISPYNLGTTVSSTKTQRDFLTTPQVVNALPESLAKDIGARNYTEATQLASSVNFLERSSGVVEELRLRGFAYPSLKINGVGAHAYITPVDVAFINNIEIAKGPGSVLFGRMEPGGIINMMLKTPFHTQNSFSLRSASDDFQRAEIDLSWSPTDDDSLRAIGFVQKHGSEDELDLDDSEGVMLSYAHTLQNDSEFNFHYRYESQNVLQSFGRPQEGFDNSVEIFINDDEEVDFVPSRQADLRSGLEEKRHSFYLSLNDWLLGDWSANMYFQYDQYEANSNLNYPVIENFELEIEGEIFTDDELTFALLEDDEFREEVLQELEVFIIEEANIAFENEPFQFDTQFYSGEFTVYNSQLFSKDSALNGAQLEQLYGINVNYSEPETLIWQTHDLRSSFVPVEQAEMLFNGEAASNNVKDFNTGFFGQWVLNWGNFTAFIGARADYLEFEAERLGVKTQRDFLESTFRIGGVYKISDSSSIFVNYSESFTPQFSFFETFIEGFEPQEQEEDPEMDDEQDEDAEEETNSDEEMDPDDEQDEDNEPEDDMDEDEEEDEQEPVFDGEIELIDFVDAAKSSQIEIGIKKSFLDGRLQTGCSIFKIEKSNIQSDILRQETRGLECDIAGSLNRQWHITVGLSLLDAEITAAQIEELQNKKPRMTPERNLRIWINRELHFSGEHWPGDNWRSRIGIGFSHVAERFIDSVNEEPLESYDLVDIGLFADYRDHLTFTLLLRNAFDKYYVEGAFNAVPAWTTPGQERTLEGRVVYRF